MDTVILHAGRGPLRDSPHEGHNRWHPAIPPLARVAPGTTLELELRDGFDGQLTPSSTADDVERLELYRGHPLTGPVAVDGLAAGDLLDVSVLAIDTDRWGYTAVIPGVGPIGYRVTEPFLAHWEIDEHGMARSPGLPGVTIRSAPFLGVAGVAPSLDTVALATRREAALAADGRVVARPDARGAVPGDGPAATEGLPTLPPRDHGGNLDVKQSTAGACLTLRAQVEGGLLSVGDPHLAQGDGESGGTAIELRARATVRLDVRAAADERWTPANAVVRHAEAGRAAREWLVTTGIPDGQAGYLDVYAAASAALGEMTDHLVRERGFSVGQAAVLLSVAVDLRVAEIVNAPNPLVTASLPLDVFE